MKISERKRLIWSGRDDMACDRSIRNRPYFSLRQRSAFQPF